MVVCGENEEFHKGSCDTTCCSIKWHQYCALGDISGTTYAGCYCKKGYARNKNGKCILQTLNECRFVLGCPQPVKLNSVGPTPQKTAVCGKNEECICNGNNCDVTCRSHYLNLDCCVYYILPPNGCYCKKGYARHSNGECIDVYSLECELDGTCNIVTPTQPTYV